jgi:hypothetical protein
VHAYFSFWLPRIGSMADSHAYSVTDCRTGSSGEGKPVGEKSLLGSKPLDASYRQLANTLSSQLAGDRSSATCSGLSRQCPYERFHSTSTGPQEAVRITDTQRSQNHNQFPTCNERFLTCDSLQQLRVGILTQESVGEKSRLPLS